MTTPSIDISQEGGRDQVIQQIVAKLEINGGSVPESLAEFWRQVAIAVDVPNPDGTNLELARRVLAQLDEPWDDDYVDEGGAEPSADAYDTVYLSLNKRPTAPAVPAEAPAEEMTEEEIDEVVGDLPVDVVVKSDSKGVAVETIVKRIRDGRYVLDPDWQRIYVWKLKKKRRLVESLLLGLPIPSLLLFKDTKTGMTYVIDGKQRLETIAHFCAPKGDPKRSRFKTFPKSTEGWRQGEPLYEAAGKYYDDLPPWAKDRIDDTTLTLHVFEDLPADKLYQIFSRYNTGAVQLKAQEIRNAVYQGSDLHNMMWRVAGEYQDDAKFLDEEERSVASTLRSIMGGKVDRYGAYDFVGRYFAFSYMSSGSAAKATYDFMKDYEDADIEKLRKEFLRVFQTTLSWYAPYPLVKPRPDSDFHAFLATVQLVSTRRMLGLIDTGKTSEDVVRSHVKTHWATFAEDTLRLKQNSTNFWTRQADWIASLETGAAPRTPNI